MCVELRNDGGEAVWRAPARVCKEGWVEPMERGRGGQFRVNGDRFAPGDWIMTTFPVTETRDIVKVLNTAERCTADGEPERVILARIAAPIPAADQDDVDMTVNDTGAAAESGGGFSFDDDNDDVVIRESAASLWANVGELPAVPKLSFAPSIAEPSTWTMPRWPVGGLDDDDDDAAAVPLVVQPVWLSELLYD